MILYIFCVKRAWNFIKTVLSYNYWERTCHDLVPNKITELFSNDHADLPSNTQLFFLYVQISKNIVKHVLLLDLKM